MNEPGWQPDPYGRHEYRYWNGQAWTDQVADAGEQSTDPLEAPQAAVIPPPPSSAAPAPGAGVPGPGVPGADSPAAGGGPAWWARRYARLPVWAWAVIAVVVVGGIGGALGGEEGDDEAKGTSSAQAAATEATDDDDEESSTTVTYMAPTTTTRPKPTTTTVPVEELQAQLVAQVQRSCEVLAPSGDSSMARDLYDYRWQRTGTGRAGFLQLVQACIANKEAEWIGAAAPVDVDTIVKNPDAVEGQVYVLVSEIMQYDAATGPCAFLGYWDTTEHSYTFDYAGDNAIFSGGDGVGNCPVLNGIDQDDVVRLWVISQGSLTYDTQIGGSTTVPDFRVLKAEVIRKA